jgi:hypothetical protein
MKIGSIAISKKTGTVKKTGAVQVKQGAPGSGCALLFGAGKIERTARPGLPP